MNQQPNNRYRQYTLLLPVHVAQAIKRMAKALNMTENQLLERLIYGEMNRINNAIEQAMVQEPFDEEPQEVLYEPEPTN